VARDRKRARQRRGPARKGAAHPPQVPAHIPGPVEHASGDVDELDAAIVRGAANAVGEGGASTLPADPEAGDKQLTAPADGEDGVADGLEELNGSGGEPPAVGALQPAEDGEPPAKSSTKGSAAARREGEVRHKQSLAARTVAFLRACSAELQRMQWPDRRQTSQATAVVLGFVVVAGVYLGVADWVAQKIVNFIL